MTNPAAKQQLDQMITGYWISQAIYAAAKFGIADLLRDGPVTAEQLAAETSTNADALYRLNEVPPCTVYGDGRVVWKSVKKFDLTTLRPSNPNIGWVRDPANDTTFY